MKIVARLQGEHPAVVEHLTAKGITAKLVKGATIIELPKLNSENWNEPTKYNVIPEVESATFFIDCEESGGGMTNTGSGTIVCGLSGKALKPYYIPKGYSNGTHAYFSVPGAVITITGYRRDDNVTIRKHEIKQYGKLAFILTTNVWDGELEYLPETYSKYEEAASAAQKKGNCYHCRCVHYAIR